MMMTKVDAMLWCSSDLSKGHIGGNAWAYFWTSIENYVGRYGGPIVLVDDCSFDDKLASIGVRKFSHSECVTVGRAMGFDVRFK